jgi:hypothetical protein
VRRLLTLVCSAPPLDTYNLRRPYNLKSDIHRGMSMLREQTINQWREFVVKVVLADYRKASRLSHHGDGEIFPSWSFFFSQFNDPRTVSSQPSWSLMQALLSLASYLHSLDTPSNPSRLKSTNIALTTLRQFTTSLVESLTTSHQSWGEKRDSRAKVWDLRFLRWLLTLWTTNWDGLSELDQLIEMLQVCSPPRHIT